jgi:methylthioribose-1-phosphate isomerase
VCNKIGTYLKALAAHDNNIPFYVALPSTTIDWTLHNGFDIPIEERGQEEVLQMTGRVSGSDTDEVVIIDIAAKGSPAANPAFDVTPAKYVSGLITEKGVIKATTEGLAELKTELSNVA